MNKYIEKLRQQDPASKRAASAAIAFWITVIIVALWILIKNII